MAGNVNDTNSKLPPKKNVSSPATESAVNESSAAKAGSNASLSNPLRSVGMKLFILIFVSILACVLVVGELAYSSARAMVERKVSEASAQTVSQVAGNLDILFQTYEDISLQLLIDKDIHSLIFTMLSETDDYTRFEATRKLSDKISTYTLSNSQIKGIALIPIVDELAVITAGSAQSPRALALKESEWFKETVEKSGQTHWIAPQPDGLAISSNMPMIGLSRMLRDSVSSTASYVLLLEFSSADINARYQEVTLGEESELFIVDGNSDYVINKEIELTGSAASVKLPAGENAPQEDAVKMVNTHGTEVLTIYNTFKKTDWKLVGTIPVDGLVKDADAIRELTVVTALVAALLAIAIGAVVILNIGRPLVKLSGLMVEGAKGNLTVRASATKRKDEIGKLGESFNRMMGQIKELAERTTRTAEEVLQTAGELTDASRKTALSAKEIAAATEEIANGASSLATEAEKGSDLTSHINDGMLKVTTANSEMSESAAQVEKASELGTAYMSTLIEKTGLTEEMTRSMVEKVDKLKESTGSIVKILDVLNNLTKQTNILSLNATIEAARAGAAGKGFMVVADEIRKLADQSRQSIDVVAKITESIAAEIAETVDVLTDAHPLFKEQINSVKEANSIFLTVQGQMSQFADKLHGVTSSVAELSESQAMLAEAMTNVSSVAEESSATSEEVASLSSEQLSVSDGLVHLSEKLDAVSRGLKESLSQFKIS